MKFEIDLNDILGDEYGTETIQESVRRQIIEKMTAITKAGIEKQINTQVAEMIKSEMDKAIKDKMAEFVSTIINSEYRPIDRYGSEGKQTTFRNELVKTIQEQMVYVHKSYSSDKNAFTRAVDGILDSNLKQFKTDFNKKVDELFVEQAFAHARTKLSEKLGIKG